MASYFTAPTILEKAVSVSYSSTRRYRADLTSLLSLRTTVFLEVGPWFSVRGRGALSNLLYFSRRLFA